MTTITVKIPDGENCNGCDYLRQSYRDSGHCDGYYEYSCGIFDVKLPYCKKCIACKICAKEE